MVLFLWSCLIVVLILLTAGVDTPLGSVTDTPTYMPPPPDTPGSMASTPNFSNLPQPGLLLPESAFTHKKPRTDY